MTDLSKREPDPEGRVLRDKGHFVRIESTVRPSAVRPEETAEVRVALRPHPDTQAHWNNEMDPVDIWLMPGEGWSLDRQDLTAPLPSEAWTAETREFLFRATPNRKALTTSFGLPGYALYYVGESPEGAVLYRRQDFTVHIDLMAPPDEPEEAKAEAEPRAPRKPAAKALEVPLAEAPVSAEVATPAESSEGPDASQEPQAEESEVGEVQGGA